MKNRLKTITLALLLPTLLVFIWQIAALRIQNAAVIPDIRQVLGNFAHASSNFIGLGSIPRNVGVSLVRVLSGYTAGVLIAVPLGVLMGYSKTVQTIFETYKPLRYPASWQPLALAIFVSSIAPC